MWPRDRIEEGEGPQLTSCRQCGREFYTEMQAFCSGTCADQYDRELEPEGSGIDWEAGGEA